MVLLPAIDIKDGNCVRLYKGDFNTVEKVAIDPLQTALSFSNDGAEYLHMVDLDGAKDGTTQNKDIFIHVAKNTNLKIELGGGIRDLSTVEYYLSNGIKRVILGSIAVNDPDIVKLAVKEYKDKIAVGIDAKDGFVSTNGWIDDSKINYIDLAIRMAEVGVKYIIYTDISKDGTLEGPNFSQLTKINEAVKCYGCNIIASGGVANLNDIKLLCNDGLYGAICGKSIYKGTLKLKEAIEFVNNNK